MIGSIIACDHAEAADPRLLKSERLLAAGFRMPFPFEGELTVITCADRRSPFHDPARQGRADRPDPAPAWPRARAEGDVRNGTAAPNPPVGAALSATRGANI